MQQYIITSFNKESKNYKHLLFVLEPLTMNIQNLGSQESVGI